MDVDQIVENGLFLNNFQNFALRITTPLYVLSYIDFVEFYDSMDHNNDGQWMAKMELICDEFGKFILI